MSFKRKKHESQTNNLNTQHRVFNESELNGRKRIRKEKPFVKNFILFIVFFYFNLIFVYFLKEKLVFSFN